jgi:uncharacterized membrane protein
LPSQIDPRSPPAELTGSDIAQATAHLRSEHRLQTSALQRGADRLTAIVGWPGFVGVVAIALLLWIAGNLIAGALGAKPFDSPHFALLQTAVSAGALLVAVLILTTQRREDQLAGHRSQLILELSILNDQKIAKIIELIEEGRRDNPNLANRIDDQADAMSTPSDTRAVLEAIKEISEEAT